MKEIRIECPCGEFFSFNFDPQDIKLKTRHSSFPPFLLKHKNHLITVLLDKHYDILRVEQVILLHNSNLSSIILTDENQSNVEQKVNKLIRFIDPRFHFLQFLSKVLQEFKSEEDQFMAGRITGRYLWHKRREPILKMGATFSADPIMILSEEILPIFSKTAQVKVIQENKYSYVLENVISTKFMIGMTQGIVTAIQSFMHTDLPEFLEFVDSGSSIFLSIVNK
ncbi:MAG: hypothetical protein K9W44_14035 [Candidatus Lokiarchaeota archaeon]|nr:hypothetical protein [Candidatus Harpocratesius repetitus]